MKALFVVDIQEIYMDRYEDHSFIKRVNERIKEAFIEMGCHLID